MVPIWGNIHLLCKIWKFIGHLENKDSNFRWSAMSRTLKNLVPHFCSLESHVCPKLLRNVPVKMMELWNQSIDPSTILWDKDNILLQLWYALNFQMNLPYKPREECTWFIWYFTKNSSLVWKGVAIKNFILVKSSIKHTLSVFIFSYQIYSYAYTYIPFTCICRGREKGNFSHYFKNIKMPNSAQ